MKKNTIAALVIAAIAAWRLPNVFALPWGSTQFSGSVMTLVLLAGLFLLLRGAFQVRDRRMNRICYPLGGLFALAAVVGADIKANGGFSPFGWLPFLYGVMAVLAFAAVFGGAMVLLFQRMNQLADQPAGQEGLFSRITGSWLFCFVFLVLCWIPVWLAFWPGLFLSDSVTQFYQYYDGEFSAHHPLLHTLLLGVCVVTGIEADPEGYSSLGVAVYSVVQIILLAALLAWALRWLRRQGAPLWCRVCVTLLFGLFPGYSIWPVSAQKDILFSALCLLFLLEMVDVWKDGFQALRSPWRILRLVLITVLMLLMRNNAVYALILLLPFALAWAKGARVRLGVLLVGCMALYLGADAGLKYLLEAEDIDRVEMLSIPLQQMARTLRDDPDAVPDEEGQELLDTLYPDGFEMYYDPMLADPVKWASDYDEVDASVGPIIGLWARMLPGHLQSYTEAFLVQNLPYILPGADMVYNIVTESRISEMELFPLVEQSRIPWLKALYRQYDQTLTLFDLPGVRLLSDTAFQIWLAMMGLALAIYRRQRGFMTAFAFILTMWFTCLLGPIALSRYLLMAFYAVPVLLSAMMSRSKA